MPSYSLRPKINGGLPLIVCKTCNTYRNEVIVTALESSNSVDEDKHKSLGVQTNMSVRKQGLKIEITKREFCYSGIQ